MRSIPAVYLPSIAWFACALLAAAAPAEAWEAAACQSKSNAADYRDYVAGALVDMEWQNTKSNWRDQIAGWMGDCKEALGDEEKERFGQCMERVVTYFNIVDAPGLGLAMDNDAFHSKFESNLAVPECLKDQDLFTKLQATNLSNAVSVYATVTRIQENCTGSIVVPYVSATVDSIDNPGEGKDNRGRIVVWIDDNDISHYVQFTVKANSTSTEGGLKQASVVNVKRSGPDKGTYIFDWTRNDPHPKFEYSPPQPAFGNDQHCYSCHWTGVLAIYPFQPPENPKDDIGNAAGGLGDYQTWLEDLNKNYKENTKNINEKILASSKNDWTKVVGAPTPELTLDQFPDVLLDPACTEGKQKQAAITQLGATGCSRCHESRGKGFYDSNYTQMINKYVAGGLMPPKNKAASRDVIREHGDLARECFLDTARENVKTWLKGTDCP
jgi:hypothetical protein